jgi:hypothetical protein
VNGAVNHLDQVTKQNAPLVEQSTVSHPLAFEAEDLAKVIGQFQIGQFIASLVSNMPVREMLVKTADRKQRVAFGPPLVIDAGAAALARASSQSR